jgi:hypothetical protein
VRNRHDRHAGGECEGQGENQENLFHDRTPLQATVSHCQNRLGATVTPNTLWVFFSDEST